MEFSALMVTAIGAAIFVGAVLQRLSGSGMGLVLAPMLTLVAGAASGVLLANATTTISGILLTIALRNDVDWRRAGVICLAVIPGSLAGAWVVKVASPAWLEVAVGGSVLAAVCFTALASRLGKLPYISAHWPTPTAGVIGGFFNTICGVSAPVVIIHARLTRWDHHSFAATVQPIFATMGAISVLSKALMGSTGVNGAPPWWMLPFVITVVIVGIVMGGALARRVSVDDAKRLAMIVAGVGAASALVRGLVALA